MSFLAGCDMPVGDQIRLQAAVKSEARDRAAGPAEARDCAGNKRKSPAAALSCPPPRLPSADLSAAVGAAPIAAAPRNRAPPGGSTVNSPLRRYSAQN